jgi:hypothetical protein
MRQKQTRCGAFAADTPACSELPLRQHQQNPLKKRSFQQPASPVEFVQIAESPSLLPSTSGALTIAQRCAR